MKQVKVNGLVVYTGPDSDARLVAAGLVRQLVLRQFSLKARDRMEIWASKLERGAAGRFKSQGYDISLVNADRTYHVPECEHELYAANTCRTPWCAHYYKPWRVSDADETETRKDVAA